MCAQFSKDFLHFRQIISFRLVISSEKWCAVIPSTPNHTTMINFTKWMKWTSKRKQRQSSEFDNCRPTDSQLINELEILPYFSKICHLIIISVTHTHTHTHTHTTIDWMKDENGSTTNAWKSTMTAKFTWK